MTAATPSVLRRVWYTRLRDALRGRFDASLDWRLIVAEAELPAEISEAISLLVGNTRLWRGEKADVARELVTHFQDGLDAGLSAEELVNSFGEPRQAAQLIRRAKKRGRSAIWQLWRYACWTAGAIMVLYIAAGLYMSLDRPSIATDYLAVLNERPASVPEEQRAWPLYREALLAMDVKPIEFDSAKPFVGATTSKPGDANWPATQKFLTDHAADLAKLREAAARRELGFVTATSFAAFTEQDRKLFGVTLTSDDIEAYKHQTIEDHWVISTLVPYVNVLRSAASLLASDALRAAADGDGSAALADIATIYGISRHCEETPFLVTVIVAEAVQRQARIAIGKILRDHPQLWTDGQLRDLAHQIAASQINWRRGFEGERISFYDSMQRIYTDNGNGNGRLALNVSKDKNLFELLNVVTSSDLNQGTSTPLSNGGLAMLAIPATNMVVASRKDMTDMYQRFSDRALERLETPLWESADSPSQEEDLIELRREPLGKIRYLFINMLLPAHDQVRNRYATSQGEREGVLIGLALELYHREHGKWPASLAELSPRWLPELPVDRLTGEPLKYKIVDDRPVVYSVGVDRNDDNGRIPSSDDATVADSFATPASESVRPADNAAHDGDWIVWSTKPGDASVAARPNAG